jgi:hypothetical protein
VFGDRVWYFWWVAENAVVYDNGRAKKDKKVWVRGSVG